MTTVKKAVTIEEELAKEAQQAAPGGNFSAFVSEALRERLDRQREAEGWLTAFTEDQAERGRIDSAVVDQVADELRALDG